MRTIVLKRAASESVEHFKTDMQDILDSLFDSGARVVRYGIGKNTAHIRVYA